MGRRRDGCSDHFQSEKYSFAIAQSVIGCYGSKAILKYYLFQPASVELSISHFFCSLRQINPERALTAIIDEDPRNNRVWKPECKCHTSFALIAFALCAHAGE